MASKNKLLGFDESNPAEEDVVELAPGDLLMYREDWPQGRVFPADMVEMMKRKKWKAMPKTEVPEVEPEVEAEEDDMSSLLSTFDIKDKKVKK